MSDNKETITGDDIVWVPAVIPAKTRNRLEKIALEIGCSLCGATYYRGYRNGKKTDAVHYELVFGAAVSKNSADTRTIN